MNRAVKILLDVKHSCYQLFGAGLSSGLRMELIDKNTGEEDSE